MLLYIAKRVLFFIPTLLAISLITFIISINSPGDPVEYLLSGGYEAGGRHTKGLTTKKVYVRVRHELGLDLPIFYFSINKLSACDTIYKIPERSHRKTFRRITSRYGNWPQVQNYYVSLNSFQNQLSQIKKDSLNGFYILRANDLLNGLYKSYERERVRVKINELQITAEKIDSLNHLAMSVGSETLNPDLTNDATNISLANYNIINQSTRWKSFIPTIQIHGIKNQYHHWISNFLRGDFGISFQDYRPVKLVIWDAMRWTLLISVISIIITYLISLPLGVRSAARKGTTQDKIISTSLFMLYSLPNFWIATLLIVFLGGGDYLDWFPTYGLGDIDEGSSFLTILGVRSYHLILPLVCWTYPTLAFLSRQMRGGMLNVMNQDYIRTARAKGLPENVVIWRHSFKNALLPIITLFANVFPHVIAGSIVLEFIFSIPGLGKLLFDALPARNYPIIFTIVMFTSVLTLLGYLVADILYAVIDPRITYGKRKLG